MLQPVTVLKTFKYAADGINTTILNPGDFVPNMGKRIALGLRDAGFVTYDDGEKKQDAPPANKQMPAASENKSSDGPGTLVSGIVVPKNWKRLTLDQKKALALKLGAPPDISEEKIDAGLADVYAGQVAKAKAIAEAKEVAEKAAAENSDAWDEAIVEDSERFPPKGE